MQRVYAQYQPAIVVDFHHQGSYVNEDGELIKTSMFWPRPEGGAGQDAIDRSKQATWLMYETLGHYGFAEVSQYPGGPEPGIARNAYGALGSASVLVEMRGDIGQKSSGYLIRTSTRRCSRCWRRRPRARCPRSTRHWPTRSRYAGTSIDNPHEERGR